MTATSHHYAVRHFERTGLILPGHASTIAEYRAQTTHETTERHKP